MSTATITSTDTLSELDFIDPIACDGYDHAESLHGHKAAEPGSILIIRPCGGPSLIICHSRHEALLKFKKMSCEHCNQTFPTDDWIFRPIPAGFTR